MMLQYLHGWFDSMQHSMRMVIADKSRVRSREVYMIVHRGSNPPENLVVASLAIMASVIVIPHEAMSRPFEPRPL